MTEKKEAKEKKKEKKQDAVMQYAMGQKGKLFGSVLLNIISTMGRIAVYYFIFLILQEIVAKHGVAANVDAAVIQDLCVKMVLCVVGALALTALGSYLAHSAAFSLGYELRKAIMDKVGKVELGYFSKKKSGEFKKVVSEDCATIEGFFSDNLGDVISGFFTPLCLIILMFVIDWKLALAAIVSIPLSLFASATIYADKRYAKANKRYNDAVGRITADAVEYFKALPVVRIFNSKGRSETALRKDIDDIYESTYDQGNYSKIGYTFFTTFITASLLGILPMSVYEYFSGVDYWMLVPKVLFFYIVGANLAGPLMNLAILSIALTKFSVADGSINAILNAEEMKEHPDDTQRAGHSIRFQDVTFGYEDKAVLKDCNMEFPEGTITAIIGPSGAGKSTIASLLAGFYNSYQGRITIGGKEIRSMSAGDFYDQLAFVFQDNYILSDTVEANIRMNYTEATMEEIQEAAKKAQIHDRILSLPQGYQTKIGDGGHNLSGGEKQRIAISRLFLKNAPILILDEATSYADTENEEKINKALKELSLGKTVVMIAHKLSSVKEADRILVMEDGKNVDAGTHESLLESSALYRHIWEEYRKGTEWTLERSEEA